MAKAPATSDSKPFTIVLPAKAAERLEILVESGLYGNSRAEVARSIILQHLQDLWKSGKLPG
jgi:Arc/MetJ-type ribon-helix-helix transcriptional regulator